MAVCLQARAHVEARLQEKMLAHARAVAADESLARKRAEAQARARSVQAQAAAAAEAHTHAHAHTCTHSPPQKGLRAQQQQQGCGLEGEAEGANREVHTESANGAIQSYTTTPVRVGTALRTADSAPGTYAHTARANMLTDDQTEAEAEQEARMYAADVTPLNAQSVHHQVISV